MHYGILRQEKNSVGRHRRPNSQFKILDFEMF